MKTIHVSPSGKDWNPGTKTKPVQTFGQALSLVPSTYDDEVRIVLAPGAYTETSPINCYLPKANGPDAIPFTIAGAMTNVLGDRTCSAGDPTGLIYTDATLGLAAHAFVGATLFVVSGSNRGASRTVIDNTATTLTVNKPWTALPAKGDVFEIQRPAVTINHAGISFWGPGPLVGLQFLKFSYAGAPPQLGFGAAFLVKFMAESVEMDLHGSAFALFHYCGMNPGAELAALFPGSSFSTSREADWFIHDGTLSLTNRCQVPNTNNLVMEAVSITCADACTLAPNSIFGKHTDISLTTCSTFNHTGIATHPSSLTHSKGANTFLIKADKNSIVGGGGAGIRHIALDDSGGDAILLQGNSHGYIGDVTGKNPLGAGINCRNMSTARVDQGGTTSVTGASDVLVDGVPRHYGPGPATGGLPFTHVDSLCRIE